MNSTYACFEYLVSAGKPWKYFQYLSGVDLPLRTNLEMVRILKTWNGSVNLDAVPFESWRLMGKKVCSLQISSKVTRPAGRCSLAPV